MNRSRVTILLACAGMALVPARAALALRVCSYNLLHYTGSGSSGRTAGYKTVLNAIQPDILVVQEMEAPSDQNTYAVYFLANVLNAADGPGGYLLGPFHGNGQLNNACFYRPAKVTLVSHTFLNTEPRDTDRWQFRPNVSGHYLADAANFYIYSMHLHSTDQVSRDAQTTIVRSNSNGLPAGTHFIHVGDFNLDASSEDSYQNLIQSQLDNDGRALDPVLSPGNWASNSIFAAIHTQSTRTTDLGDGGASGGLDDRFDFQLVSFPLFDFEGWSYVSGTYKAYGNDAQHYNKSIVALPDIPEGAAIANALHTNSDHLPVKADYEVPAIVSVDATSLDFGTVIVGATAEEMLTITNDGDLALFTYVDELTYTLAAPAGFTAPGGTLTEPAGGVGNAHTIAMDTSTNGNLSGTLVVNSDDVDFPATNVSLSGTVLDHALPSVDGGSQVLAGDVDFGSHGIGGFSDQSVAIHNFGFDSLQALLNVYDHTITGPDAARFSVTDFAVTDVGASPVSFTVHFDDAGAASDTAYAAALEFSTRDQTGIPGGTNLPALTFDLAAFVTGAGVPGATITGAVSRKSNPGGPGGACDTALVPGIASEPHQGGVSEIRIAFDIAPGGPGANPVALEEATCASPAYVPYSGVSAISGNTAGNELVLTIVPGLENARTYKLTIGPDVTSIAGQFVEVRGLAGDANGDGLVNGGDRSLVVGAWTGAGFTCSTDVNSDGLSNGADRSLVVGAWTGAQNCAP